MNWQTIFNPFSKFSEKQLFVVGFGFFCVTSYVCFFTQTRMNSIFHFAPQENVSLSSAVLFSTISIVSAILFLFLMALLFYKKTRLIDIINTVLLSQAPNFLILLCIKYSGMDALAKNIEATSGAASSATVSAMSLIPLVIFILLILILIIYGFVLLYNGFKTATNLKKWQHIALFIVALLLFMIFHQFYIHYLNI
jgi:hypothetical protein